MTPALRKVLLIALLLAPIARGAAGQERRPADLETGRLPRLGLDPGRAARVATAAPVRPPGAVEAAPDPDMPPDPETPVAEPEPVQPPSGPEPSLVDSEAARQLRTRVQRLLRRSPLGGVRVGVVVADAATGQEWVRVEPDAALNPASTLKLFTSAAALDRLGPEHRFHTEILVSGRTVVLRGNGDPMLDTAHLAALVKEATPALRRAGPFDRVLVDPFAFSGGVLPPGFGAKNTDASYRASTGAVALDWGTAKVEVWPTREGARPRVVVTPPGDYLILDNRARTVVGTGSTIRISLRKRGNRSVAVITGRIGRARRRPTWVRRRIEHPPLAAAFAFAHLLDAAGIQATGTPEMGKTPRDARRLVRRASEPLQAIVATMNKQSNNFIAEMLLRGLARPRNGRQPATWDRGRALVRRFLTGRVGLDAGSFRYNNGSGLYDGGRFSPRQVVRLLVHMNQHTHRQAYRESLAVAGEDGTLVNRLRGDAYRGKMIGKTGTLNDVSALSGYARNRSSRLFAFSILMNDTNRATPRMRKIQDRICALLIDSRD